MVAASQSTPGSAFSLMTRGASRLLYGVVIAMLLAPGCRLRIKMPAPVTDPPVVRRSTEWVAYGGDPGGLRYSELAEITPDNVGVLEVAWSYRHARQRSQGSQPSSLWSLRGSVETVANS